MSRHRAGLVSARKRHAMRAGIAAAATAALVAATLSFIAVDSSHAPDLGKSVKGSSAAPVEAASAAWSSKSVSTDTVHLETGTFRVALASGPASSVRTSGGAGGTAARIRGPWSAVGSTGIQVASATSGAAVRSVDVRIVSQSTATRHHLNGVVIEIGRADGASAAAPVAVRVPEQLLDAQYGADYAARLHWMQLPAGKSYSASRALPIATTSLGKSVVMTPMVAKKTTTLAATSGTTSSTGTGSFGASSLKPASSWDVSAQTGDFSYSYPMTVPPAPSDLAPTLSLNYDSQSIDGETGSTNNQPSAVGDGWDVGVGGFIERQYVSCAQDDGASGAVKTSGDLCWKADNAVLSLGGHSSALVRDATTGTWKMQSDDGSRIEHLVGTAAGCAANGTYDTDCWRVTTTDGTQYYFGKNELPGWASGKPTTNSTWTEPVFGNDAGEPCHASTFAASACTQAWRWNLDYVVDVHSNAEAFYYDAETNSYGKNGSGATSYVRGGQLDHVDYGITASTVYATNAATGRITFGYDAYGRCSDTTHAKCTSEKVTSAATKPANPTYYPDVPWDQFCTASCTSNVSPTYWTDGMLDTITTSVKSGSSYANVDLWTLGHSFPSPGDSTNAALWLTQVQHTGYSGSTTLAEPAVKFYGVRMQNRVWAVDGLAPLDKLRISGIANESGAMTSVNYSAQDCTASEAAAIEAAAATNTRRCYPQWWSPDQPVGQDPKLDLFHKYLVTSVVDDPKTGGGADRPQETDYVYTGTPGWRYNTSISTPANRRTWSVFAGYDTVEVREGIASMPSDQKTTDYTFYRGMDGDRASTSGGTKSVDVTGTTGVTDSQWLAGQTRETVVRNGVGGSVASDTVTTPWASAAEASDGTNSARMVRAGNSHATEPTSDGSGRSTDVTTTYDSAGLPTQTATTYSDAGATCATTTYAPSNTTAWIIGLPQEQKTVNTACGASSAAADLVDDSRTSYDSAALGTTPTKGDATKTEEVTGFSGTTPVWSTTGTATFDALGRTTKTTDELNRATTTSFTPATGGPVTAVSTVNPKGWTSTQSLDPARGNVVSQTDVDGAVTTVGYDALGRRTQVWLPGHAKADFPSQPNSAYAYTETQSGPMAVLTTELTASGTKTSAVLYDGLGRVVQTQAPSSNGGSVITDSAYDSQGRTVRTNNPYWASGTNVSNALFVPSSQAQIQSSVATTYDALGRAVTTTTSSYGTDEFHTTTAYKGADEVDSTPPTGGTPTSTFTDSRGNETEKTQYLGPIAAGTPTERTTYAYDGRNAMTAMTDPAGNAWAWTYDVQGNKLSASDPDSGLTTYTYDAAGNQTSSTDARGRTLVSTYDQLDRKTAERLGSASGPLLDAWTFDTIKKGQPTASTSYVGSTADTPGLAYSSTITGYDAADQPTGQTISIPSAAPAFGGTSYTTSTAYKADESVDYVLEPAIGGLKAEQEIQYYDALGQSNGMSGLDDYGGVTYDSLNRVADVHRSGATVVNTSTYTRDTVTGAVTEIQDATGSGSSRVTQADRVYTRDDSGNITSETTTGAAGAETQCYRYDGLQELTSAWTPSGNSCSTDPTVAALGGPAPYWTSWSYDTATGNRLSATQHTSSGDQQDSYAYPAPGSAHPHAVQAVTRQNTDGSSSTKSFAYDEDGDATADGSTTLTYDDEGKVASATIGAQTQNDVYDADGDLLLQVDPKDGATLFLGDTELHQAIVGATTTAVRTYSYAGTTVAERTTAGGVTTLNAIDTDVDGTADMATNWKTGAVTRRWFDPFGNARGTAAKWSSNHGFLNKSTSTFTALTQLGARLYDSAIGRFLSVDPVLAPDNPLQNNGYSYSANDPVTFADPSGACYEGGGFSGCTLNGSVKPTNPYYHPSAYRPSAPTTHAAARTPVQPYGHGGSKSANYPSKATQKAQSHRIAKFFKKYGLDILLGVATIGIAACIIATVGICATVGVPAEVGLVGLDAAAGTTTAIAATSEEVAAADAADAAASEVGESDAAANTKGGVYSLRDEAGNVVRTGRTKDFVARRSAHGRDSLLGQFKFRNEYHTDDYAEQRGLEDKLYNDHPEAQKENGGYNKIRAISPKNPKLLYYQQAANDFLLNNG